LVVLATTKYFGESTLVEVPWCKYVHATSQLLRRSGYHAIFFKFTQINVQFTEENADWSTMSAAGTLSQTATGPLWSMDVCVDRFLRPYRL